MAELPFETRTLEQLTPLTSLSPDALTAVQEPGGPMGSVSIKQLLGRLVQTDTAKETRADLLAELDHDEPAVGLVFADPDPAKNGWYRKVGASGAGTWTQFEKLSAFAAAEIAEYVSQASDSADIATTAADAVQALTNLRATRAEGVADFAVGVFFASAETGDLRIYKRTAIAPFYQDEGDAVAPLTKGLLASADPGKGAALVTYVPPGDDAAPTDVSQQLARRLTPEDYGAAGDGVADDGPAFLRAANEAVARGVFLRGIRGSIYRLGAGINAPAGLHFDGEGCTIKSNTHFNMLTFLGGGVRFYNCTILGAGGAAYNANGKGLVFHGVGGAGPGVAPTMLEDIAVEGVTLADLGHTAVDLWYTTGIRTRDLTLRRLGYAGVLGYSIEDFDGRGFDVDTLYGETTSGEMNAYAVSFTSAVGAGDDVRNPPSRRCYAHEGVVRNMPTWHALDTHGGRVIGYQDWQLFDVRRGVAITNRGDDSAHDCYVKRIRSFNSLPFALGVDGEPTAGSVNAGVTYGTTVDKLKKDSAVWVTGFAGAPSKNIHLDDIYAEGHGRPGQVDGNFFFEHCDLDARRLVDRKGYLGGVHAKAGVTGLIEHRSIDLIGWDDGSYPNGSYGYQAFDTVRPLTSSGGNFKYQGRYERTTALPAGVFDLDALINAAGAGNRVELVGNGVKNKTGAGLFIGGDADYVTGNYSRGVILTAGVGQFSGTVPSGSVLCTRDGDSVELDFAQIGGTSISPDFTLGILPPNFRPRSTIIKTVRVTDNDVAGLGLLSIASSGLITLLNGPGGGAWTAALTKNILPGGVSFVV